MNEPESVAKILSNVLQEIGAQDLLTLADIDKRWPEIVGEDLAKKARPYKIAQGVLFLATPSPVWSQEVLFARWMIMDRVREAVGIRLRDIRATQRAGAEEDHESPEHPQTTEKPGGTGAKRDALATLRHAQASYERAKAKK